MYAGTIGFLEVSQSYVATTAIFLSFAFYKRLTVTHRYTGDLVAQQMLCYRAQVRTMGPCKIPVSWIEALKGDS